MLAKNNYSGNQSVGELLSTIETNVSNQTGAIYTCIQTIPKPPNGSFGLDTVYYNNVDALTNYYYYYEAIGLSMLSEAYHYYVWVEAGSPGGSDSLSSDSVQILCSYNGTTEDYCNNVEIKTNELYNSLVTQFTFGGAPYTNEYTLLQYNENDPIIWVRSLEDFTSQAGFSCNMPLNNSNLCGPLAGYYTSILTDTIYRGSSGFGFAAPNELNNLINPNNAKNFSTNGKYMESLGFKNMEDKTIITNNFVYFSYFESCNPNFEGVPFLMTDLPTINIVNENGWTSVFNNNYSYNYIFNLNVINVEECDNGMSTVQKVEFTPKTQFQAIDSLWTTAYAVVEVCKCNDIIVPFNFTNPEFGDPSRANGPGFMGYMQDNKLAPKRFLLPRLHAENADCSDGRVYVNAGNMISLCGNDFQNFLNTNVPRPPTCNNSMITPQCVN